MPDAMENLTLASEQGDDGGSETTFGSSPTQVPVPTSSLQSPLMLPPSQFRHLHTMELEDISGIYCPVRSG